MINLQKDGIVKSVPTGFSWTTLFFGPFPALIRGDILWGVGIIIASTLTGGLAWLIFPFIYNKYYIKALLEKGYSPVDSVGDRYLREKEISTGGFSIKEKVENINIKETVDTIKKSTKSNVDELRKWNDLYKEGAITEEEYNRKKEELLK